MIPQTLNETTAVTTGTKAWNRPGKICPVSILRDDERRGRLWLRIGKGKDARYAFPTISQARRIVRCLLAAAKQVEQEEKGA